MKTITKITMKTQQVKVTVVTKSDRDLDVSEIAMILDKTGKMFNQTIKDEK